MTDSLPKLSESDDNTLEIPRNAPQFYVLDDNHNTVPVKDVLEWSKMFGIIEKRRVKATYLPNPWNPKDDEIFISTVFLGLDHGWGEGPPMLFETMIFNLPGSEDEYQTRCSTWEQAEAMHEVAVEYVEEYLEKMKKP
jgi:hypothetical protein